MSGYVPPGWAPTLKPEERDMQSLYREREAQRAAATQDEIQAEGIYIDENGDIHEGVDIFDDCPPLKKLRIDTLGSHLKKWKTSTFDEFVEENRDRFQQEVEIEMQYQALFSEHYMKVIAELGASDFDHDLLSRYFQEANTNVRKIDMASAKWDKMMAATEEKEAPTGRKLDLISSLSTMPELVVALGKHLTPREILTLYSISRDFKYTVDHNMQAIIIQWGRHMVGLPGMRICMLRPYETFFVADPLRRTKRLLSMAHITHPERPVPAPTGQEYVRPVPGIKWLQMVVHREIRIRDMIAVLARNGHRLPRGAFQSLRKLWMIMDISTSKGRTYMMSNPLLQPRDLIHMQMFFVKLQLLFNDPIYGPGSSLLLKLMLGQRSLTHLWLLLRRKKYTTEREIIQLKLRYDVAPTHLQLVHGRPVHGVPLLDMGMLHFEGWGKGEDHLIRPDQLVALEAARRQLGLGLRIRDMMRYGHCDQKTGAPAVPSLDEMYMSDDELPPANHLLVPEGDPNSPIHAGCGNVPFEPHMWQPKHARKARWATLTAAERDMILDEEWRQVSRDFSMDGEQAVITHAKGEINRAISLLGHYQPGQPKLNLTTRLPDEVLGPLELEPLDDDEDVDYSPMDITPPTPTTVPVPPPTTSIIPPSTPTPAPLQANMPDPFNQGPTQAQLAQAAHAALLNQAAQLAQAAQQHQTVNQIFAPYGIQLVPDPAFAQQRHMRDLAQDTALLAIADPNDSGSDSSHLDADADLAYHGEDSASEPDADLPPDDGEAEFLRTVNPRNLAAYRVPTTPQVAEPKVETLDEHLLNLADGAEEEDDQYDSETGEWFDWEGHLESVRADVVGEVQKEVRKKKGKGKGKKVVKGAGQDGEDADDEMEEEEEEEDERVKMLRGYYRAW